MRNKMKVLAIFVVFFFVFFFLFIFLFFYSLVLLFCLASRIDLCQARKINDSLYPD